jgi:hypothetical protein
MNWQKGKRKIAQDLTRAAAMDWEGEHKKRGPVSRPHMIAVFNVTNSD